MLFIDLLSLQYATINRGMLCDVVVYSTQVYSTLFSLQYIV